MISPHKALYHTILLIIKKQKATVFLYRNTVASTRCFFSLLFLLVLNNTLIAFMIKYQEGVKMSRSEKLLLKVLCGTKDKSILFD